MKNPGHILYNLLKSNISLPDCDVISSLGWHDSFTNRLQIKKTRLDLVRNLGPKMTVYQYVLDLNLRHQTNNMLPIHILRKSVADTLLNETLLSGESLVPILLELSKEDELIQLIPLNTKEKYHPNVIRNGIVISDGTILYYIRQCILTTDIIEASVKLDPLIHMSSSDLDLNKNVSEMKPSKQPPVDLFHYLKALIDHIDLSSPKERASQVAFMLNDDLRSQFQSVCKHHKISVREGLHAAVIIFCKHFKSKGETTR